MLSRKGCLSLHILQPPLDGVQNTELMLYTVASGVQGKEKVSPQGNKEKPQITTKFIGIPSVVKFFGKCPGKFEKFKVAALVRQLEV